MSDWHTHVFTSTYTADVSGVCSVMYELGGMTVLHDPSGCNSTYTTHDEPRWYDSHSLMFTSGLDEMGAIFGDDEVLIKDVVQACADMKPRFITLCGASIPHIIAFDYKGVAHLIEEQCGVPVIPVATDGLKSYVSGVGLAMREWIKRFAKDIEKKPGVMNILGATPIDFSRMALINVLQNDLTFEGNEIGCTFAMGDTFENLENIYGADVNLLISSSARTAARFMLGKKKIPYVEGITIGPYMHAKIVEGLAKARETKRNVSVFDTFDENAEILVIGEEIYAKSMATAINHSDYAREMNITARPVWPDVSEGFYEDKLLEEVNRSRIVVADPLFANTVLDPSIKLITVPHEGYSGRIFRDDIPVFTSKDFDIDALLKGE